MKQIRSKTGIRRCAGLIAVGLLALIPLLATGQSTSDDGTITVTAEVSPTFLVESIQDLDFGNLLRDSQKSINALTGAVNTGGGTKNSLPNGQRGGFVVIADPGSQVKFSLGLPTALFIENTFNAVIVNFARLDGSTDRLEAFITQEGDVSGTLTDIGVPGAIFGNVISGQFNTTSNTIGDGGDYFTFPSNEITAGGQNGNGVAVVIGGTVNVPANALIGQYTSSVTLTVEVED